MVIESPTGGFVYLTPDFAMANLQSLQRRDAVRAWKQGIKTLYYMRTESVLRGDIATRAVDPDCVACDG